MEKQGIGLPDVEAVLILGTRIAVLNLDRAVSVLGDGLDRWHEPRYVCVTGVHGVMEGLRSDEIQTVHNRAAACVPDGMPLVWFGRLRGHREIGRVYGPDLMLRLLELAATKGYTNFFYGGAEGVAEDLQRKMQKRFPGLQVVGTYCPPFRPLSGPEEDAVVESVNAVQPDILWVGLSTPKQELQMARFKSRLDTKLMLGVGAAFDFHTGRVRQAPSWMQRCGLEWFFRLSVEPKRLARRYLRNNPAFLFHIAMQLTGVRKYPPRQ